MYSFWSINYFNISSITEAYDVDLIDDDEDETIETPYISLDNLDLDHLPIENCIKIIIN